MKITGFALVPTAHHDVRVIAIDGSINLDNLFNRYRIFDVKDNDTDTINFIKAHDGDFLTVGLEREIDYRARWGKLERRAQFVTCKCGGDVEVTGEFFTCLACHRTWHI